MRFSIQICRYEHETKYFGKRCSRKSLSEMTGLQHLFVIFKLRLRLCDLSHRVEQQKLVVISRKEMSVRVQKGGCVANLLLASNILPNVQFYTL